MGPARDARHKAFNLVELLVVIAIIAILIALLMPALRRARNHALRVTCHSQLRQLTAAVIMYANENRGWLCGPIGICDPPGPQSNPVSTGSLFTTGILKDQRVWLCPVDDRQDPDRQFSYTYNGRLIVKPGFDDVAGMIELMIPRPHYRKLTSFRRPSECIVFAEENITGPGVGNYLINDAYIIFDDVTDDRHLGKAGVSYLDGHVGDIVPRIKLWHDKDWGWCH